MAFRLAAEEGLFWRTSPGANVTAALRLAERLGPKATIVTILCDTRMSYLRLTCKVSMPRIILSLSIPIFSIVMRCPASLLFVC
ncbi:hypothetical protein SAMN05414139_10877 [Burkholderia sp. D7]|nr:hypothetical protein SAMN05414139_10877 [Burkholderia sp. D7]